MKHSIIADYTTNLEIFLGARLCAVIGDDGVVLTGDDSFSPFVSQHRCEYEYLTLLLGR